MDQRGAFAQVCSLNQASTQYLTGDAGLGPFTDDGTPGNGHFPLLKDSQAVDAGNDAFCPRVRTER
jgi:hypothetical protein